MFDLDKEIDAWCRSVRSNGWKRASRNAELKDHLYCEVERLLEEGLSEKQAFLAATERMGNVEDLRLEYSKNRNLVSTFSDFLQSRGAEMSKAKPLLPTITMSIGILLGGLLGAAGGSFSGNESVVMVCYVLGFLGGAVAGTMLGWRWHSRRNPGCDTFTATYYPFVIRALRVLTQNGKI
jgi:hypothetical protein